MKLSDFYSQDGKVARLEFLKLKLIAIPFQILGIAGSLALFEIFHLKEQMLFWVFFCPFLYFSFAINKKRWRDMGYEGKELNIYSTISVLPGIGVICFWFLLLG